MNTPTPEARRVAAEERARQVVHEWAAADHEAPDALSLEDYIATALTRAAQEAREEAMEEAAKIAECWEPDGSDKQPMWINGWESEQTRTHIAAALRQAGK